MKKNIEIVLHPTGTQEIKLGPAGQQTVIPNYAIERVVNTVDYAPGQRISKVEVQQLIDAGIRVVVKSRGGA